MLKKIVSRESGGIYKLKFINVIIIAVLILGFFAVPVLGMDNPNNSSRLNPIYSAVKTIFHKLQWAFFGTMNIIETVEATPGDDPGETENVVFVSSSGSSEPHPTESPPRGPCWKCHPPHDPPPGVCKRCHPPGNQP